MSDHVFYDEDIVSVINNAHFGNEDVVSINIEIYANSICLHKDDVIHLAKQFGLVVFESESQL